MDAVVGVEEAYSDSAICLFLPVWKLRGNVRLCSRAFKYGDGADVQWIYAPEPVKSYVGVPLILESLRGNLLS